MPPYASTCHPPTSSSPPHCPAPSPTFLCIPPFSALPTPRCLYSRLHLVYCRLRGMVPTVRVGACALPVGGTWFLRNTPRIQQFCSPDLHRFARRTPSWRCAACAVATRAVTAQPAAPSIMTRFPHIRHPSIDCASGAARLRALSCYGLTCLYGC